MISRSSVALLLVAFPLLAARSQVVTGRVTERAGGTAMAGAIVSLVDSTDRRVVAALADDSGRYRLAPPRVGRFTLRVDRVGFASVATTPFVLAVGDSLELPLAVASDPVRLATVRVAADRRCLVRPAEGEQAAALWGEVRKALDATELTVQQSRVTVRVRHTQRLLDPRSLLVRHVEEWEQSGETTQPFVTADPALLAAQGFVVSDSTGTIFYAPDAAILLSENFLDTHCLRPRAADDDHPGEIGLAFEPAPDRRLPEVAGTLWLDVRTASLRELEFGYANVAIPGVPVEPLGGRLWFDPLPDGRWVVSRWYIRMPKVVRLFGTRRYRLEGIDEVGAQLVDARRPVAVSQAGVRATTGAVRGVVYDSLRGAPAAGLRVSLAGTSRTTVADGAGRFAFDSLPPNAYQVRFERTRLDSLVGALEPQLVGVSVGETTELRLARRGWEATIVRLCVDGAAFGDTLTVVTGRAPAPPPHDTTLEVAAQWRVYRTHNGATVPIDQEMVVAVRADGSFDLCGVPVERRVALVLRRGRRELGRIEYHPRARTIGTADFEEQP